MTKNIFIITLIFISIALKSYSCDCSSKKELNEARELEFKNSEIVFVGEVNYLSQDKKAFEIKIIEIFKGKYKVGQVLQGKNNYYCEPYVDSIGKYLIYGNIEKDRLSINSCGLSRSFDKPEKNRYFRAPPPPPPPTIQQDSHFNQKKMEKEMIEKKKEYREKAIVELEIELGQLRKKK